MNKKALLVIIWCIVAYFFYEFFQSVDFNRVSKEIGNANGRWLVVAFFFNFLILLVWTCLWSILIPRNIFISFRKLFQINTFMATSCNTLPFPGGHALGLILFSRLAKIKHSVALSVLALDQMMEGIVKVGVLTLAASFSPLPVEMQQGIQTFIVLILIFSVLMFCICIILSVLCSCFFMFIIMILGHLYFYMSFLSHDLYVSIFVFTC